MLFPLPLTPFERYYLADDRPDYPTTIPVELEFHGRLEEEPFRAALDELIARHPLLGARVEQGAAGPQWIAAHAPPWLDWKSDEAPMTFDGCAAIDLEREAGLRVWVRAGDNASRALLQFHHACCDGLSVLQVVGDLLVLYDARWRGQTANLPPLSPERLRDRAPIEAGAPPRWPLLAAIRDTGMTAWVWRRILFRRCATLASPETGQHAVSAGDHLAFDTTVLDADTLSRLKRQAAARQSTLNELLLRAMCQAVQAWNASHGQAYNGRTCINVPVYVRGRGDADIPASNGIGFAFVSLDPRHRNPAQLLRDINAEMYRVKHWKLALYFLGGLALAAGRPRLMRWALDRKKPLATAVVSYLGTALARVPLERHQGKLVSGSATLERIIGVPPVRPFTYASVVVLEYGGELAIGLRTDPARFTTVHRRALLDRFVRMLVDESATDG